MIVPLSEDRRIRGTKDCWQLESRRKRAGKSTWQPYKYYSTFDGALGAAAEEAMRTLPAETLAEAIEGVRQLTTHYAQLFEMNLTRAKMHERGMRVVS